MWIIPKNLHTLASVQDTEALISDSDELSELYAQSLLARSKASQSKTWSRRLKRGTLTLLPYGRTLRPSRGSSFEDEWTSSQEASLVSHLVPQDEGQEMTTPDTCGPTLQQESDPWGTLPLFSSRMLRGSSAQSSKGTDGPILRERPFCCMSSESWSAWVTKRRREYSQRAKSARPISANECSSWVVAPISVQRGEGSLIGCSEGQSEGRNWATPNTMDNLPPRSEEAMKHHLTEGRKGRTASGNLREQVIPYKCYPQPIPHQEAQSNILGSPQESPWATPQARDWKGAQGRAYKGESLDLPAQAWATPIERDYKGATMNIRLGERTDGRMRMDTIPRQVHYHEGYKGKLNPRWVETLMGLPVGWVMPSCATPWTIEQMSCACSVTGLSPQQQSEPSECCGPISGTEN